jgi:hypothetical protein
MAEQPSTQLAWAFHGPKAEWLKIYVTYLWDNKWDLNIYSPYIYIYNMWDSSSETVSAAVCSTVLFG